MIKWVTVVLFVACNSKSTGTVRMGFSAWPGWIPWQIADEKDLFTGDVSLTWYEGYLESINAFSSGALDANTQTLNDTIASVALGSEQVIVLVNDNSTGNDKCIVDASIKSVADLRGKTIAVETGTVDHYLLILGLQAAGVAPSEVKIVSSETGAAALAFASNTYDGVCVFAPFTTDAFEREGSHELFSSKDFPGAIPDYLVVSRAMVEDRPTDVQALVDTWWAVRDFMNANPDDALDISARRARTSVTDYRTYADGTTLFSVQQNLDTLKEGDCSLPPAERIKFINCAIADIYAFLAGEGGLIPEGEALSAEQQRAMWDASFMQDYARRH